MIHKRTTKDYQLGSKELIDTQRLFVNKMKISNRILRKTRIIMNLQSVVLCL